MKRSPLLLRPLLSAADTGVPGSADGHQRSAAPDPLLTVGRIAEATDYDEKTVRRWIRAGRLKAIRLGREFRIRPEDFLQFLEENEV